MSTSTRRRPCRGRRAIAGLLLALSLPATAAAEGKTIVQPPDHPYGALADGPGAQQARNLCGICHSTDYIVMQPRGDARQWEAVVTKMIKVFGAPISEADA
ncbi:MAG TPA: cytochrome c, partial [Methylomirabilota bacterium]|nr:cytochrome c [Methylomirabilota bacterium]